MKNNYIKVFLLVFVGFTSLFFNPSCSKQKQDQLEQSVVLDKNSITLKVGEQIVLQADFGTGVAPLRKYQWISSNSNVATAEQQESLRRATVTAKSEGTTIVSIRSDDGQVTASCKIEVTIGQTENPDPNKVIKVLAIGNSFSEDAVEHYLYGLAEASGIPVIIGNMYIGGSTLDTHVQQIQEGKSSYEYRKIVNGVKTTRENTSLATALADETWDYISFQHGSPYAGLYNTYVTPLPILYNYVRNQLNRSDVKYILHQTWAYAQNSTHSGFANYNNNQMTMYNAIVNAYNQVKNNGLIDAYMIVPSGTAIQNGRTSVIGDNFCRDGYHLDLNIGRYTASCAWYEALFGKSVIGNTYKPVTLSDYEVEIAQHAAHLAVQNPNGVTPMTDYQTWPNSGGDFSDIFIDFGSSSPSEGWNAFTSAVSGYSLPNLRDKNGKFTYIKVDLLERFNGRNAGGPTTTSTSFDMPAAVSSTSYYGNSKAVLNGRLVEQSVLKFSRLQNNKQYSFCFFGSRIDPSATDNRETAYKVTGQNEKTVLLNTLLNTSKTVCVDNISPNAAGEITITITAGPNNTHEYGGYYINAMKISVEH